jgi:hypothetical protein
VTDADYAAAGVRRRDADEPELDIVRLLAHKLGDELFLAPPGLLRHIGKPGLEHLFRLDGWRQPDSLKGERPSAMPCWREVVEAIDAKAKTPPASCAKGANSHWTKWTDAE